ncbi:MAG: PhnD/SsuA/transferrin family substrate-binding protein [Candidatus Scalindua sp.]
MKIYVKVFIHFLCLYIFCSSINAQEHNSSDEEEYRVAYGYQLRSMPNVLIKDAKAALKVWANELGNEEGLKSEVRIYKDLDSLIKDFQKGKLDLISVDPLDYLLSMQELEAELAFNPVRYGKKTFKYLLLVRTDSPFVDIRDLRGKKLVIMKDAHASSLFLNTLLLQHKQEEADRFFFTIEEKNKVIQVILSIFFGQADICIVPEGAFKTMAELNPQVGKQLRIIDSSQEIVWGISLFHKDIDEKTKEKIKEITFSLKERVRGRQILMLFKFEDIVQLEESSLDTLKSLLNEYENLKQKN